MGPFDFAMLDFMKFITMIFVYGFILTTVIFLTSSSKNKKWFLTMGVASLLLGLFGFTAISVDVEAQIASFSNDYYYTLAIGLGGNLMSGIFCLVAYIIGLSKQQEEPDENEEI